MKARILYLLILTIYFISISFEGKTSLISFTPDQPEYVQKFTYEIIQAANLSCETKKAKFFIIIAHKRLEEAVKMTKKGNCNYIEELIRAYKDCLTLGIETYKKLKKKEDKEEILSLLEKCLFKNVIDLTYLLRNLPEKYKSTIQKSLDYTLDKRKEVEKIIEDQKKEDENKLEIDK